MSREKSDSPKSEPTVAFRALTRENYDALIEALAVIYGQEAVENMTVQQVFSSHPDLVRALDGKRQVGDLEISDEQMNQLTPALEKATRLRKVRDALGELVFDVKKKGKVA